MLEKLTVHFQGSTLRSYAFTYGEGAFNKDVLTGVKQLDDKGTEVSYQKFEYYDDVQAVKGYVPFKEKQETWNTHNDHLGAGFLNPLQFVSKAFSDKPSALGGTTSFSLSGSFYAGIGPMDGDKWKGNTIGASYGYSLDKSNGVSTLVDINGDGLPDKVFRKGGALYYRPQIPTSQNSEVLYGEDVRIVGVSGFSKITSSTHNGGAKATVGYQLFTAEVGVDFSSTKTKTTEYLSDINGDGLVDLVFNKKVYFNLLSSTSKVKPFLFSPSAVLIRRVRLSTAAR